MWNLQNFVLLSQSKKTECVIKACLIYAPILDSRWWRCAVPECLLVQSMRCKKVQKLLKSRCKFCTRIFRVCYTYVMHIFAYVTDIVSGVFFAHVMHILRACYAYSSRILNMHYVWCAYSSCMLRVSSRMLRVFFAHVTPILRKGPQRGGGGGVVAPFRHFLQYFYDALLKC